MFGQTERVNLTKKLHNCEFVSKFKQEQEKVNHLPEKKCPSCPEIKREENYMTLLLREQLEEPRPQEEHVRAIIRFSMSRGKNRPPQGTANFESCSMAIIKASQREISYISEA